MGLFTKAIKAYNNLRGFTSKRTLLNTIIHYKPLNVIRAINNKRDIIPEDIKMLAKFAEGSYISPSERTNIGDWLYIPEYSDEEISLYKKGDKFRISHRGTVNAKDVLTDSFVLNNNIKESDRYKNTKDKVDRIVGNFGLDKSYKHIGHSLGGSLSKEIARDYNQKSIGFNPGQSTIYNKYDKNKNYVIGKDPVSNSLLFQDKRVSVFSGKPGLNPHTLKNFL